MGVGGGGGVGEPLPLLLLSSCFECSHARMQWLGTTAAMSWLRGESRRIREMPTACATISEPLGIHGTVYIHSSYYTRDIDPCDVSYCRPCFLFIAIQNDFQVLF